MKLHRNITMALLCSVITCILFGAHANAAVFNPGNIISDSIFVNTSTMTADQIQDFIKAKGANCTDGEAPCLKNYTENGKSVGTIIAEAARDYSINPQVLLVLIQKESGLLLKDRPASWRYRTATGYGCPDTSACDSQYFGFTNQVRKAASMFHRIMIYDPTWYSPYEIGVQNIYWNPNLACGYSPVNIVNRATVALYDYTPYQPNAAALAAGYGEGDSCSSYGNRNFWLYFNSWFGSSTSSLLIQSPKSPAVYLQSGDTKYAIPSWDIIDAYGLGKFGVTAVTDSYMDSLIDGGILSTIFSNKDQPGPIYMADNGYRFGFASYQQCVDWGFPKCTDPSYAKPLDSSVFNSLLTYGAISPLMLNGNFVSIMKDGKRIPFLSHKARVEQGYESVPHTPVTNKLNTFQTYDYSIPENNSMVSFKGNSTIYAYADGQFYSLTFDSFNGLKSQSTSILYDDVSKYNSTPPSTNGNVKNLVNFSDGKYFALSNGQKIDITNVVNDWPATDNYPSLKTISDRRPADYVADNNTTYRTETDILLKIDNQKWRGFYSSSDYSDLNYSNPISISNKTISDIQEGFPIFSPGNGTLFQVQTKELKNMIYTLSSDDSICQIYSMPQISLYKLSTENVPRIQSLDNKKINILSTTVYDNYGDLHIVHPQTHSIISANELSSVWGISNRMNICSLKKEKINKNPVNRSAPKFVRNEHTGIIYLGENGKKRPIYSYDAFLRLGGNSNNTQDVSMEFLVSSPDGSPITK